MFQFGAGERIDQPCVESRMLLWSEQGEGRVRVNGQALEMTPGSYHFLPWGRRIEYLAAARDPFRLGGIHLIPWYAPDAPVVLDVAHEPKNPLYHTSSRSDAALPWAEEMSSGHFDHTPRLRGFVDYLLGVFAGEDVPDAMTATLGELLLTELEYAATHMPASPRLPGALRPLVDHIACHLHVPLGVGDLIELAELSPSTLHRLFRQNLGVSPGEWIARCKFVRAQTLLRTTRLPIGTVGERVGMADAYHFSKWFKQRAGVSPAAWRGRLRPL